MSRLLIIIAVIAIAYVVWFKIKKAKGAEKKKLMVWSIAGGAIAILGFLAITGRLTFITAAFTGLIAMLPKAMQLVRYLPILNQFRQQAKNSTGQQAGQGQQGPGQNRKAANNSNVMSQKQAREILGLKGEAGKEEIIKAHKRMMQKVHPDRGGSDYLAAQINKAKETLLG
ncbi:MAG: molecular chaperone DnaJ [Gammaproteobacteria bacterium]|nr:molecular chaperone DnaJ [Gammaproteobacteria bacterium]